MAGQQGLDLKGGEDAPNRHFSTFDDLLNWIVSERSAWKSIISGRVENDHIGNLIAHAFSQLEMEIRQSQARGDSIGHIGHLLYARYMPSGPLIDSQSLTAERLIEIRKIAGDLAVRSAYGLYVNKLNLADVRDVDSFKGLLMIASPGFDNVDLIGERLKAERMNFRRSLSALQNKSEEDRRSAIDFWSSEIGRFRASIARLILNSRRSLRSQRNIILEDSRSSIEGIKDTEKAFVERMRLQAPVEYWRNKANSHMERKDTALKWMAVFFPSSILTIILIYAGMTYLLVNAGGSGYMIPNAIYFIISAGLISASAVIFWIGRLLTKVYISENHLRYDAEERATMTTTYLALTRESAASDLDRQIILSALFRSSSDGLVKDDGAADVLSPAALIARLGSSKP